jgi:3-oxoacid CoA-transferase B subunit
MSPGWTDEQIARRLIADLWEGAVVNLGVGMPGLVSQFLPPEPEVILHSENGLLGFGPPPAPELCDRDLVNAGREFVTLKPGASLFHSADSFAMLRGGHVDVGVLGAYQVSERGDLANWKLPGQKLAGVGGAADICAGVKQVWVMMKHRTSRGEPRLLRECTYSLTAKGVVKRVYTDMAVVEITPDGMRLMEAAPGYSVDELRAATGAVLLAG